ncbi:hypothetical protein FHR95_001922 [Halomonas fontilapidosi]|mgnify:CR=1|uniref:Uncharacterized protein n=1 Tax=Halomonas fontilapidosi TaxID=616675 RepID=A0A7W5DK36_9GAMM|nr:hypothetical protein [Halomonas fontilapidosi]MBB3184361.1 hypothetical protein [Halomonas fontilapidosi]
MIWHLIAALFAGLGAAGIGLILRLASGKRLPRWIIPACGGLGMLAYQIHNEYSWFEQKKTQLPASAEVVAMEKGQMFWRPWTFAFPMTTAFTIVDRDSMAVSREEQDRLIEFILYRFEKEYVDQVSHQAYLMNCATREMLPLEGESRTPATEQMRRVDAASPLYEAVCENA